MEELFDIISKSIDLFPWVVVLVTVRTVYKQKPKKTKIQFKEFFVETER